MVSYRAFPTQVFTVDGAFLRKLESGSGQPFDRLAGIALDRAGNVLVCVRSNMQVQVLTASGAFVTEFGLDTDPYSVRVDKEGRVLVGCRDGLVRVFAFVA